MNNKLLKPLLWSVALATFSSLSAFATMTDVYPVPQKIIDKNGAVSIKDGGKIIKSFSPEMNPFVELLNQKKIIPKISIKIKNYKNDGVKFLSATKLPKEAAISGAYLLNISKKGIQIIAFDSTGVYYAAQTLSQLVTDKGELPYCNIQDWPDTPYRGTVEGFYGAPWKHEARLSQIRFYGKWKMNTYIYGPKDDPFHGFSNRWREPYPEDKAKQIKELVDEAKKNYVNFVWAVHPGRDIKWTDKDGDGVIDDFKACVNKYEMMYKLGVRAFAIFFDDIGGEGAKADRQVEMLNYLNREFIQKKNKAIPHDVATLVFCPTQYAGTGDSQYIRTIGDKLDKEVAVMWTGPGICSDTQEKPTARISELIKRKPYIWWNWPVSDYCRTALLLGRTYGPAKENKGKYAGFVSNPMDKPEASKIALFGVGDYSWNLSAFDSKKSWEAGVERLYPDFSASMQVFANHNSDQGPNGHGYRREESVDFKTIADVANQELNRASLTQETEKELRAEFNKIDIATKELLEKMPKKEPMLYYETEFWIKTLGTHAKEGNAALDLLNGNLSLDKKSEKATELLLLAKEKDTLFKDQRQRAADNTTPGDRGWSRGCVAGGLVVAPLVKKMSSVATKKLYKELTGKDPVAKTAASYQTITNVDAFKKVATNRNGIYVRIDRVMEPKMLNPGDYIGVILPENVPVDYIHLKLENKDAGKLGKIQVSSDGQNWEDINSRNNNGELQQDVDAKKNYKAVRFINKSSEPFEIKINQFKIDVPANSFPNSKEFAMDKNLDSSYEKTFEDGEELKFVFDEMPKNVADLFVYTDGNFVKRVNGNQIILTAKGKQTSKIYEIIPVIKK